MKMDLLNPSVSGIFTCWAATLASLVSLALLAASDDTERK